MHVNAWIPAGKFGHQRRQQIRANGGAGTNGYPAAAKTAHFRHGRGGIFFQGLNLGYILRKNNPRLGEGAQWLIARVAEETDLETLNRAAMILSEIGEPAMGPVINWLNSRIGEELQCALLQTVAWMAGPLVERHRDQMTRIIEDKLQSPSADVREKAIAAASRLPKNSDPGILPAAYNREVHEQLKGVIAGARSDLTSE